MPGIRLFCENNSLCIATIGNAFSRFSIINITKFVLIFFLSSFAVLA